MNPNPYKYKEPLDPEVDKIVCVPRIKDVNQVIQGIIQRGDYFVVLGPGRSGRTTFLRQIRQEFSNAHYIYVNFKNSPSRPEDFYQFMIEEFLEEIPSLKHGIPSNREWKNYRPELQFIHFMEKFKPKEDRRIVLQFDGVDASPFLSAFLHLWRKVFHERYHKKELNRYAVIAAGAVDLISQTIGPNSPFNIAKKIHIKDFSDKESEKLIDEPMKQLNIEIETRAKNHLISKISGHPQLLQHACHLLVEAANSSNKTITQTDVNRAIEFLLVRNSCLETLRHNIENNNQLKDLLQDILNGQEKKYYPYKNFSIQGAGPIVEKNSRCVIRNKVYEEFIKERFFDDTAVENSDIHET